VRLPPLRRKATVTVHVGELTSEVRSAAPGDPQLTTADGHGSRWERELDLGATLARLELDRLRTATGPDR
jgi:hypothetical protein